VWFQKISIPPHRRSLEIPRERGVQRQKFLRGVEGKHLFQRVKKHEKIESNA